MRDIRTAKVGVSYIEDDERTLVVGGLTVASVAQRRFTRHASAVDRRFSCARGFDTTWTGSDWVVGDW